MAPKQRKISNAHPPIEPLRGGRTGITAPRKTQKTPDWDFWVRMRHVKVWQAVALSLNIDPDSIEPARNGWMGGPGSGPIFEARSFPSKEAEEAFEKRLRLLSGFIGNSEHFRLQSIITGDPARCEIYLSEFATWAVYEMKWDGLPPELLCLAVKTVAEETGPSQSDSGGQLRNAVPSVAETNIVDILAPLSDPVSSKEESVASSNWIMVIQTEAARMFKALRAGGASPTKHAIKDKLAKWCRDTGVRSSSGIYPSSATIYRHVLRKWDPPD